MAIEEFIQHQAVSGSLTMKDRQYLELCDVERVIQMVREECGYEPFEAATAIAYWYFIDELTNAPISPDENGKMPPLRFREGCGLHPFPVVRYHTRIERSQDDNGWRLEIVAPLALKESERLPHSLTDNSDSGRVALLLPFNDEYITTWDGMHTARMRISYDRIVSILPYTPYATIRQTVPAVGFDSLIKKQ